MKPAVNIPLGLITAVLVCLLVGFCPLAAGRAENALPHDGIVVSAQKIVSGHSLLVQIDSASLQPPLTDNIQLHFEHHAYRLYPHPLKPQKSYFAIIGISYRSAPGPEIITLDWSNATGRHTRKLPITIVSGKHKTDVLKVDGARVTPSRRSIERAAKESRQVKMIYANSSDTRLWHGPFRPPMKSQITSPFGNRRVFNGRLKSYHNGVDFRAAVGTPVFAANSGVVRLAQNLFYSGNVVVIDHGTDIFTIYAHLSKMEVRSGQFVAKGQRLGLSGATGRVSGPHLHWGVKINGVAVDPMQFIRTITRLLSTN